MYFSDIIILSGISQAVIFNLKQTPLSFISDLQTTDSAMSSTCEHELQTIRDHKQCEER